MSATIQFASSLAPALTDFVAWKRCQGYDYTSRAIRLARFDRFLSSCRYTEPILTARIVEQYLDGLRGLTPLGRYGQVSAVRVFAHYLKMHRPDSYRPLAVGEGPRYRPRFYLYSPPELSLLLAAAGRLPPQGFVPPTVLRLLLGVLYTTGLRISEALALDVVDLHLDQARLLVRHGKFGKDRWLALHPTTVRRLRRHLQRRPVPVAPDQPLFATRRGTRLTRGLAERLFRRLVQRCGIDPRPAGGPRLHDLRHTFACDCLRRWQQQGADLQTLLPVLPTALGHTELRASQLYLHTTAAQLQQVSQRYRSFTYPPSGSTTP